MSPASPHRRGGNLVLSCWNVDYYTMFVWVLGELERAWRPEVEVPWGMEVGVQVQGELQEERVKIKWSGEWETYISCPAGMGFFGAMETGLKIEEFESRE